MAYKRPRLAPLEPDRFLAWAYWTADEATQAGSGPLTLDDVWFQVGGELSDLRRAYVRIAARVRANQRVGRPAWEGVVR